MEKEVSKELITNKQLEYGRITIGLFCLGILLIILISMYNYIEILSSEPCEYIERKSDMICIIDPKFTQFVDDLNNSKIQHLIEIDESFGEFKEEYNGT